MIRAIPFFIAAMAGMWVCVPAARVANLEQLAMVAAALGALNAGYSAWAERIDKKLGVLDRLNLADRRIQRRLTDRVGARRSRLAVKRVAVFVSGVLAMLAAGIFSFSPDRTIQVASVLVSMSGAFIGATGCVLLFMESTSLDERASELQRYADRLKASEEEAEKLRAVRKEGCGGGGS